MTDQWYPEAPQEQQDQAEEQRRREVASLPVVQDVLDWFDNQIATYDSTMTISGINPSTSPEDIKAAVLLAQTLITDYTRQRDAFKTTFSQYIKEEDAA